MFHFIRRRALMSALVLCSVIAPSTTFAQEWPSKPIRLIVNFPPGSSPDVVGRAVATPLSQALAQPIVIENRAGAGGIIGAEATAKAAGDGHTLLMASGSTMVVLPSLTSKLPYDTSKDFVPVAAAARVQLFLVVRSNSPFTTFADFVKYAKANPGKLTFGSPGNGTTPHVAGEMLKSQAGFFAVHIPYRGSAPALQDLLAGNIDFAFDPGISISHIRAGTLRLLAVASAPRSSQFPDVLTLDEHGMKGFDAGSTHSFYAPAGTAPAIVERLNREINRALALPAVIQQIRGMGAEPTPMSPAQLRAVNDSDTKRYAAIIKERKITQD